MVIGPPATNRSVYAICATYKAGPSHGIIFQVIERRGSDSWTQLEGLDIWIILWKHMISGWQSLKAKSFRELATPGKDVRGLKEICGYR